MWRWLTENHGVVSAVASCLTLLIWLAYLHLFYLGMRRAQRSNILISIAGGARVDSECILANMSRQPIYIDAVTLSVAGESDASEHSLSDAEMDPCDSDLRSSAMQGPLASGEKASLGSFRKLLHRAGVAGTADELRFSLLVTAVYAGDDRLVAAERAFVLRKSELYAASIAARQLRSWRHRKTLRRLRAQSQVIVHGSRPHTGTAFH